MKTSQYMTRRHAVVDYVAMFSAFCAVDAIAQQAADAYEEHGIDEIVVEGSPLERTIRELAQPTGIVGGDALTMKQAASIGETLSHELGVSSSYFGPVSSRPVIRGQFGERVRVLSNSLDSLDASALSEDHAVSVDSILAERVEIVRGPATLLYGSGAAGGLVNVIDNRIFEHGLDEPFGGTIAFNSDSATGKKTGAGEIAFGTAKVGVHLDYFRRDTDNVHIPGFAESAILRAMEEEEPGGGDEEEEAFGTVENTDSTSEGGAAAISLTGDNGHIGLSVSRYDSIYGIPGHHHDEEEPPPGPMPPPPEEEEEAVRVDLDQTRIDLKGAYSFGEAYEISVRMAHNDYRHVELEGSEVGTLFDTQGVDSRIEFRHGPIGNLDGAIGLQYRDVDFDAVGEEAFVPPSTTEQFSLFAFEELPLGDRLVLQGSARIEWQTIDTPSLPSYDDSAFGFGAGAIWSFAGDYSLAFNYALTERHPNATELYADGPHVAVNRVERGSVILGDGILDKELSSNIDLTLRGENDHVEWVLTAFLNDIDDYILLGPTAAFEDELQVFEYTQADARLTGLEAEARIELLDTETSHLHLSLFADLVRGEDTRTQSDLPRMTPLRYGLGLHYTLDRFEASADARFHEDQDRIAPNELPTDGYTLLSAEVSYVFTEPDLFVYLRGTNLGDEDARQHTSPLKDTVPLPGRSLQLGLRYNF